MDNYSNMILSTANSIEGYRIIEQCGIVFGETVFKHSFLDSLSASISNTIDSFSLRSKEMSGSMDLIETARKHAYDKMIKEAKNRGANAIIAIDSDNTVGNSIMYISLYGTAVKIISNADYEHNLKREKEQQEEQKKEQERLEAKRIQRQKEINEMREKGEASLEMQFLETIATVDTFKEVSQLWEQLELSDHYPEINKMIKNGLAIERAYGKIPKDMQSFKSLFKLFCKRSCGL